MCFLTNERYKTYQTRFLVWSLGHALGMGLWVLRGQNQIPSCCMSVMLYPSKPLDEIQPNLVCELLSWMRRATAIFGPAPWGPGELSKGQISFNFNYKVNFKDFYTKLCVCSHKWNIKKHIRRDFHSIAWVMPQGWDFGVLGVPRWSKIYFHQTWSCGISNRRGWQAEQNASKICILGSNWWPWVRSKVKYH